MNPEFFDNLKEKIQPYFSEGSGHEFSHTQRVYNNAIKIAKGEDVDIDIVKVAALLHDIARIKEDNKEVSCHAVTGAEMAKPILIELGFPEDKIDKVCYAIKVHRFSNGINPETKEAQIIQDADRLDALGAMIIARVFAFGGKNNRQIYNPDIKPNEEYIPYAHNTSLNHFYEKSFNIKPETFKTEKAKKLAEGRYKFLQKFVERFLKEWEGEA